MAIRFRYPLQKIVDLKGSEKTQAQWHLSAALVHLRAEELSLSELFQEKASIHSLLRQYAEQQVTVIELQNLQAYVDFLDTMIERKQADLVQAQHNVSGKQQLLLEKTIDEKVWHKAREKSYQQFRTVALKKEQQQLDEIAASRYRSGEQL